MPRHPVHRAQKLFDPRYTREPRHKHLELYQARTRKRTLFRHSIWQARRQDQATRIRFLGGNVYRMRAAHFGGGHTQQEQFWEDGRRKRYGTSCPIPHSYQTWNYSYMGPFELMSKHIAEQKERKKQKERTHKHGMKLSSKSGFPHASNSNSMSDSPKQSHRRSSMSFSTPDENSIQPQQQEITEWAPKNEAAKMKETETPPDPNKPRTQESTHSFKTSDPNTPRPNILSRSARSTRFATLDETARLQQQKIAEWIARNLANKARIKEAEAEAEAEAESKTEEKEKEETEASTSSTDIYSGARFPEFPQLTKLEFHNHTDDHPFIPINPPSLPTTPTPTQPSTSIPTNQPSRSKERLDSTTPRILQPQPRRRVGSPTYGEWRERDGSR